MELYSILNHKCCTRLWNNKSYLHIHQKIRRIVDQWIWWRMFIEEVNKGGTQTNIVEMEYNHKWVTSSKSDQIITWKKRRRRSCHMQPVTTIIFWPVYHHTHCLQLTLVPPYFCSHPFVFFSLYSNLIFMFIPFWILKLLCPLGPPSTTSNFNHVKPAILL